MTIFGLINNTADHLNATVGEELLLVPTDNWLWVASRSAKLVTRWATEGLKFDRRMLDVAILQMIRVDEALSNRHIRSYAVAMETAVAKLQECLEEGMPWTPLGSLNAAIACWVFWGRRCAEVRPAQWLWGSTQMKVLLPHTCQVLLAEATFLDCITFRMLTTADGEPRGVAAL
jgi:hypothetical protein